MSESKLKGPMNYRDNEFQL